MIHRNINKTKTFLQPKKAKLLSTTVTLVTTGCPIGVGNVISTSMASLVRRMKFGFRLRLMRPTF